MALEPLCASLLPEPTARNGREIEALKVLLGQAPGTDGEFLRWPSQEKVAKAVGQTQPKVSGWARRQAKVWTKDPELAQVRDEIVALLDARGAVMSAVELAEALIATRGSYSDEPKRTAQAVGVVRAAVEVELARGGDARLATRRFRDSGSVLVGRESDDPTAVTTADDFLSCAVRLGACAAQLARCRSAADAAAGVAGAAGGVAAGDDAGAGRPAAAAAGGGGQ